jgi:hypothetical protein
LIDWQEFHPSVGGCRDPARWPIAVTVTDLIQQAAQRIATKQDGLCRQRGREKRRRAKAPAPDHTAPFIRATGLSRIAPRHDPAHRREAFDGFVYCIEPPAPLEPLITEDPALALKQLVALGVDNPEPLLRHAERFGQVDIHQHD